MTIFLILTLLIIIAISYYLMPSIKNRLILFISLIILTPIGYILKGSFESFTFNEENNKIIEDIIISKENVDELDPNRLILYLESKLNKNPKDLQGWLILARTCSLSGYLHSGKKPMKTPKPHNPPLPEEYVSSLLLGPNVFFKITIPFLQIDTSNVRQILHYLIKLPHLSLNARCINSSVAFFKDMLQYNLHDLTTISDFLGIETFPYKLPSNVMISSLVKLYTPGFPISHATIYALLKADPITLAKITYRYKMRDVHLRLYKYIGDNFVADKCVANGKRYMANMPVQMSKLYETMLKVYGVQSAVARRLRNYTVNLLWDREMFDTDFSSALSLQFLCPGLAYFCHEHIDFETRRLCSIRAFCFICMRATFSSGCSKFYMHSIIVLPCCGNTICRDRSCLENFLEMDKCYYCKIKYDGYDPCFDNEHGESKETVVSLS